MKTEPSTPAYQLQPHHFILLKDGKIIFWDYRRHAQFEITLEHFDRLREFSCTDWVSDNAIDTDIMASGALVLPAEKDPWRWDALAHIFHHGTCHPEPAAAPAETADDYARHYALFCESIAANAPDPQVIKGGSLVDLPPPDLSPLKHSCVWPLLQRRRTCRDFDGGTVALQTVADLLFSAFGAHDDPQLDRPANMRAYGYRRTSPSAGGLQCTEPYLWALRVAGLRPGIYHYLSCRHALEVVQNDLPALPLGSYLCQQNWANDMAFAIVMTARFDKMWWKYPHSRAYRPMLMDIGHLSQTLCLTMTAYGLHPWLTGYFHDQSLAEILCCEPAVEYPLLLVGGGSGSGSSYDRETRALAARS